MNYFLLALKIVIMPSFQEEQYRSFYYRTVPLYNKCRQTGALRLRAGQTRTIDNWLLRLLSAPEIYH